MLGREGARVAAADRLDARLADWDAPVRFRVRVLLANPGSWNRLEMDPRVSEISATYAVRRSSQVRKNISAFPEVRSTLVKLYDAV
jgi:hypothetical protein